MALEQFLHLIRRIGQAAALDRLHDDDGLFVLARDLVAGARLDAGAFPVRVIDLQLDKIDFRVVGQDSVEHRRGIVEGKADLFGLAFSLELLNEFKAAQLGGQVVGFAPQIVQQVVVKVLDPAALELLLKVHGVFFGFGDLENRHFVGQQEAVARVTLDQALTHRLFAVLLMIREGGVDISEAFGQEAVKHGIERLIVNVGDVLIEQRQAHAAKAELFQIFHRNLSFGWPARRVPAILRVLYHIAAQKTTDSPDWASEYGFLQDKTVQKQREEYRALP